LKRIKQRPTGLPTCSTPSLAVSSVPETFEAFGKYRVNTRGMLRRRNMYPDSYTRELCLAKRGNTLFIRCNFAKACWHQTGILIPQSRPVETTAQDLKNKLNVPFFVDIIILMCWSIWVTRNDWIFNNVNPTSKCKRKHEEQFMEWIQEKSYIDFVPFIFLFSSFFIPFSLCTATFPFINIL
jgi:hypothetical protein